MQVRYGLCCWISFPFLSCASLFYFLLLVFFFIIIWWNDNLVEYLDIYGLMDDAWYLAGFNVIFFAEPSWDH